MIKLVYCFRKKSDISVDEFARYWGDEHASIGKRIPGIRRFVQSLAIRDARDAHAPSFDGMVELWFDDVDAVLRARQSPAWRESTADEARFIEPNSSAYFLAVERNIA